MSQCGEWCVRGCLCVVGLVCVGVGPVVVSMGELRSLHVCVCERERERERDRRES